MKGRLFLTFMAGAAFAVPVCAQDLAAVPPVAAPVSAQTPVDAFYDAHPGILLWLRDADTRAAAEKLPDILRRAPIDGLADGPPLAAEVEAAINRGQPADDRIIASAWVRYVQSLARPVEGVSYGDPALKLEPPSAGAILADTSRASLLAAHVDTIASVNPLYASLREVAVKQGTLDDRRVRGSLDRLRLVPASGRAILVDAASQQLWMLEDGKAIDSMKVVVGKTSMPTPLLAGTIHYVTFNPYWHIPDDVARRKVAPVILKRGVSYLKAARYETAASYKSDATLVDPKTIDWKAVAAGTEHAFIRQLPGANNMMGKVKFGFENDFDIFLHDTPHKELFAKTERTFSMGCIRLERADSLAHWLLGREPEVSDGDAPEQNAKLDKGVPVYVTYLTAVAADGQLAFASDVYGLDQVPDPATPVQTASAAARP
jgi:lipoprotein-anchoring transpeptidase ErfK/SrfK